MFAIKVTKFHEFYPIDCTLSLIGLERECGDALREEIAACIEENG